ncbi:MAG: Ig domain-containing protein [Ruminiclostridium sp.]|nr:Ig domain-containing protein [Ruminiclostridium sp.]
MKFKRLAGIMLAIVMVITTVCAMSVTASAASVFSGAKTMKELETYTWKAKRGTQNYYKIEVPRAGTIKFGYASRTYELFRVYDSKMNELASNTYHYPWDGYNVQVSKKGTYYLKLESDKSDEDIVKGFYYVFTPSEEETIVLTETLNVGDKINLSAAIANYDGKAKWTTSNKKVATIENGVLKAVGEGKATITASIDYETVLDEIRIVVKKAKVPVVMFTMNAKVGDVIDLGAGTANYKGAVTWTSSDKKVATVDNGKVTAVSKGTATIKASIDNGSTTTSMMIVVK